MLQGNQRHAAAVKMDGAGAVVVLQHPRHGGQIEIAQGAVVFCAARVEISPAPGTAADGSTAAPCGSALPALPCGASGAELVPK